MSSSLSHGKRRRFPSPDDRHGRRHPDEPRDDAPRRSARAGHGRRRAALIIMILVAAAVVWFLPVLVTRTPLLGWIVARATGELDGTATIGSASLGWFSPVRASGLRVVDKQGALVADVPALAGDATLAKLATNWRRLGTLTIERPTIHVVLRGDGSNIEDLIAKYLKSPGGGKPVAVELRVVDATIDVQDQTGAGRWTIEKVNITVATSDQKDGPLTVAVSGELPNGAAAGRFDVKLQTGKDGRLDLETSGLELAKLEALLARFAPGTRLAGRLDAAVACRWGDQSGSPVLVAAKVNCVSLDLACNQLGSDRVRLATAAAEGQFAMAGDKILLSKAHLQTDVGQASLDGQIELAAAEPVALVESLLRQSFHLTGDVDLARAAAMLPGTLHVAGQTTITRGQVRLDLTSRPDQQGTACQGQLDVSDLAAVHRGQPITWEQPISVSLAARRTGAGVIVDRLECRSSFLTAQAGGDRRHFTAQADVDLDQLARQLQGFVDLGGLQLSGKGSAHLGWQHDPQNQFRADAKLTVDDLRVSWPQRQPWQEGSLVATFLATGATDFKAATRLESANLEIKADSEQLTVRLAQPLANVRRDGPWPLAVDAQGNLAHWMARVRAWNVLPGWDAAGTYRLTANLLGSLSSIELRDSQLMLDGLHLGGGGLNLNEAVTRLAVAGQYDLANRRLAIRQARLECNTLAVDADDVVVSLPAAGPTEVAGNVAYRGDLARLQGWITAPGVSPTWRAYGQLQGNGHLKQAGGTTTGQLDATVARLTLQSADGRQFQEPQARLAARGVYDRASGRLKLDELLVATSATGVRAAGQADQLAAGPRVDLAGQLGYDWPRLLPLVQPYLGNRVNIAGRSDRPFLFRGPLNLASAEASASFDWSGAYVYGCQVGPGELAARLGGGVVQFAPLDLSLSEGRLVARPRLRLAPSPAVLEIEPGQVMRQVRINPDMCAQGLQYVAPILAGVATAEGRFSIDLDQCHIRLDDPAQSVLAGRLTVHSVEVGPGALVRELAVVLNRESPAKLQRESVIRFQMADGRVYHEGLELVFPELTVRTHGWVGVDQTMSLVAQMPFPPKWLAGNRVLDSALANQTLQVPIRGTLGQPQIDHRKLEEYNKVLLRKATQNALEGELNRQLNRLFEPKKSR